MSHALTRSERLLEMERLYLTRSYSDLEMADRLGVNRTTVFRDRIELEGRIPFYQDEEGRYRIDRSTYISELRLNLAEALSLYLAARRASQQTRLAHQHVARALEKLSVTLRQPMTERLVRAADAILAQRQEPERPAIFATVATAWAETRRLKLVYRALRDGQTRSHRFEPYLLEPSPWSDGVYLIGHSDLAQRVITLKLDRIVQAELLGAFELPADFDEEALLRHAWGIWGGEEAPATVVLRFAPGQATRRLKESIWHPLEQVTDLEDGGCRWQAPIAEWQEMLPWIRGWGAEVEVLEPRELREAIEQQVRRMSETYAIKTFEKEFIAHIREKDRKRQSLLDHLFAVSDLTRRFASKIGLSETGALLGLLHDLGKASDLFQQYIRSGEGLIDPDAEEYIDPIAHKGKIDHTTAGAQVICQALWDKGLKERFAAQVMALCIASHHSGLIDCLTPTGENNFRRRMDKPEESTRKTESWANLSEIHRNVDDTAFHTIVEQIFAKLQSLQESNSETRAVSIFKAGLLIRFLLSCLLDADRLDTADFEMPGNIEFRNYGRYQPWETLIHRLDNKIREFENKPAQNDVDRLRTLVSRSCLAAAANSKGIYQLTVPTGGGKTLSSLRFALHHAAQHDMERIFYVIPYTSIIDQNAHEIRKTLEDKDEQGRFLDRVVLEHHSNLTPDEESRRQGLLAQNWDAPIVLTTQVQFLEALFGSGTRSARRMHQLANAVIILDEVQAVPIRTVHMLNLALRFLVHACGASVVLCTATQPPLDKLDTKSRSLIIEPDKRIIEDEKALFARLNRVEVHDERRVEGWSEEQVAQLAEQQLEEMDSVLIVVNTRRSARLLYDTLAARNDTTHQLYHLSTNMCPVHRLEVLEKIKDKLLRHESLICVSTQLIEAGVDIDFGVVIRYLAGLDSIAQSAGRCNRHGLRPELGRVWIVNPRHQHIEHLPEIGIGTQQAERVLDDFRASPARFDHSRIGVEAMADYYKYYYDVRKTDMNYPVGQDTAVGRDDTLFNLLAANTLSVQEYHRINQGQPDTVFPQSFRTAAQLFRVIESPTRGVLAPYQDEGKSLIATLCANPDLGQRSRLLKRAQRYSVNLFPHEFDRLRRVDAISETGPDTGMYYFHEQFYTQAFGWNDESAENVGALII